VGRSVVGLAVGLGVGLEVGSGVGRAVVGRGVGKGVGGCFVNRSKSGLKVARIDALHVHAGICTEYRCN